jgi:hypothetical protein
MTTTLQGQGMLVRDLPERERPVNRLRDEGATALSTTELLACLLQTGHALEQARELLVSVGGLEGLARADELRLREVEGVGPSQAARLLAALELRRAQAKQEARTLIRSGNLTAACQMVNGFYRWLPPVMQPGLGIDWQDPRGGAFAYLNRAAYLQKEAHTSWIAEEIPIHLRHSFIVAAIENELWSGPIDLSGLASEEQRGLKRTALDYVRLLGSWAVNALELETAAELGTPRVSITTCNDEHVCSYCQAIASRTYAPSEAPVLPSPHCSAGACRCWYNLSVDIRNSD